MPGPGASGLGATHGKPVLADLLLTPGHKSVVFGTFGGRLWVVTTNGTTSTGILVGTLPGDVYSTPAVGDLDGDGLPDIVVGYGSTLDPSKPGGFRAYKNHGPGQAFTLMWDHPTLNTEPPAVSDPVMSSPAIGDVDGDGIVEVAVGGLDYFIYLVDGRNGNNKPGWPYQNTDTVFSSPALFDLDGDGKLEIIIGADYSIGTGGRLHAFRPNGSELPGFPVAMDQAMSSSPAIGDIDGDGKPEIVIGTANYFANRAHKLYAFHCDGSPVLGWPVSVDGQVKNAPALGDLDGDGIPDVVAADDNSGPSATYHVYAFKGNGNAVAGWAGGRQPKDFFGQSLGAGDPVIADILNGPEAEVLVPTNGEICVFSNTGVQLTDNGSKVTGTFTFNVGGTVGGVAVGDFDGNGVAVSVVAISGTPFPNYPNSQVYAWNTGKSVGVLPWPQFLHDAKHSGVFAGTPTCAPRAVVATKFFPLTPCRVLDTRLAAGPLGAPSLQPTGSPVNPRRFAVAGVCGVPASAVSISANLSVTNVSAQGELVVYPGDATLPGSSALSFHAGKTRANNALVYLSSTGSMFSVYNNCSAAVDFILDVNGYFQ